jgi:hypothetical protein
VILNILMSRSLLRDKKVGRSAPTDEGKSRLERSQK